MRILLFMFFLIASSAAISEECHYRQLNPSAQLPFGQYPQPALRPWDDYDKTLLQPFGYNVDQLIRPGSVVMDVGCGRAVAMHELAQRRTIEGHLVNTQDVPLYLPDDAPGSLHKHTGWAEEVLPTLPDGFADVVFDFWGAWSWSPAKHILLQNIYRALKPGGSAFILYDRVKVPVWIYDPRPDYPRTDMALWLMANLPADIFTYEEVHWRSPFAGSVVLHFKKPLGVNQLQLNLAFKRAFDPGPDSNAFLETHLTHSGCVNFLMP